MSAQIDHLQGNVKIQKRGKLPEVARIGMLVEEDDILFLGNNSRVEYTCDGTIADSRTAKGRYGLKRLCPITAPMNIAARETELLNQLVDINQELAVIKIIQEKPAEAKQLLENALSNLQVLGDQDKIINLQEKINGL